MKSKMMVKVRDEISAYKTGYLDRMESIKRTADYLLTELETMPNDTVRARFPAAGDVYTQGALDAEYELSATPRC